MSNKSEATDRRIDSDEDDDLVGVAGLGVLGAARDGDDRERTGERLEQARTGHVPPASNGNGQAPDGPAAARVSRRGALAALTGLGVIGFGSGTASAGTTLEFAGSYSGTPTSGYGLELTNEATSGVEYGLKGISTSEEGRGVFGRANPDSGSGVAYGVLGKTDSDSHSAAGVMGKATATSGRTSGVRGQTQSPEGRAVVGRAFSDSGKTFGVIGKSDSSSNGATGVRGVVSATSGKTWGVQGRTHSPKGRGVQGRAFSDSGETVGVRGKVESPSGTAVHATNTTGEQALQAEGDADVTGVLTVGKLGAEAYLGSDQTVSGTSPATVGFDTEGTDDRNEFDTADGSFVPAHDGAYLVTAQVTWASSNLSQGDTTSIRIAVGGNTRALKRGVVAASAEPHSLVLSKTLRDLTAGTGSTIEIEAQKDASSDWTIVGDQYETWVEITQIG